MASTERSRWKCEKCRTDKKKCLPKDRKWPDQKCYPCIRTNKPCGPNKSPDGRSQEAQDQQQTCDGTARDKDNNIGEGSSANSQAPSDNVQKQQASPIRQVRQPSQTEERPLMTEQGCYQNHEDEARSLFEHAGIIKKALDAIRVTQGANSRSGVQDDRIDWICKLEPKLKEDLNQTTKDLEVCTKNVERDRYICLAELTLDSHEKISSSVSQILGDLVLNETDVNATNPFPVSRQLTSNGDRALILSLVYNAQRHPDILNISEILRRKWIHTAAEGDFQDAFDHLIDLDPDIDAPDIFGVTALFLAASCGNERFCTALLKKGADVGRRAKDSRTILEVAAKGGFLPVVELLIDYNAEVNATSIRYASTALQAAAQGGHYDVVDYLLQKRANVNAKNFDGNTAEALARQNNHDSVVGLLLKHKRIEEGSNFRDAYFSDQLTDWSYARSEETP